MDTLLVVNANRIKQPLKIDGIINEPEWALAVGTNNFYQSRPDFGVTPTQKTSVKILYDDNAIYIAAILYDSSPDSILKQLGSRDEGNLNADDFYFKVDPYLNNQDAYEFGVNAAGIQFDDRFSDYTYDAVWNSAVKINNEGWVVEMEIPYSAIRFPKVSQQQWGLQFTRNIRRRREFDEWALTPLTASNPQIYWGTLNNIVNIKSPLRLTFTPYVSSTLTRQAINGENNQVSYQNTFEYNAGTDIKYGIDDRFTLDMILLPDFGQVQSDKKVKNLSYQEVVFDENRPFFKEGVELFGKDDLFYSRRIGKTPSGYNDIYNELKPGESVVENPSQSKLLNAFKISGRTNNGLGIGFFNAITNHTYAEVKDSTGSSRKILTEPLTDYNIIVFDQQLKNNSNFFFINTHTNRDRGFDDANVTDAGALFSNKKNTFLVGGNAALSQRFKKSDERNSFINTVGYKFSLGASKAGGKIQYGYNHEEVNSEFNTSDIGPYIIPGYVSNKIHFRFQQYNAWKKIRESFHNFNFELTKNFSTDDLRYGELRFNSFANLLSYNAVFIGVGARPFDTYDYRESRSDSRKYRKYKDFFAYTGFSSDYRKKVAIDLQYTTAALMEKYSGYYHEVNISFRFRISDHLFINTSSTYSKDPVSIGYAYIDDLLNKSIFGLRKLFTYENRLSANYIFVKDMSLRVTARHYWNIGDYEKYFNLLDDGELEETSFIDNKNDFSSNFFNVDVMFEWRFAPGSYLNLVYKNAIENDGSLTTNRFDTNFNTLINAPQTNNFSIKVLYYLDYVFLKRISKRK